MENLVDTKQQGRKLMNERQRRSANEFMNNAVDLLAHPSVEAESHSVEKFLGKIKESCTFDVDGNIIEVSVTTKGEGNE